MPGQIPEESPDFTIKRRQQGRVGVITIVSSTLDQAVATEEEGGRKGLKRLTKTSSSPVYGAERGERERLEKGGTWGSGSHVLKDLL